MLRAFTLLKVPRSAQPAMTRSGSDRSSIPLGTTNASYRREQALWEAWLWRR